MSNLINLLQKFKSENITATGKNLLSFFALFLLSDIFFPFKDQQNNLITDIKCYYFAKNIYEIVHYIYHMLLTLYWLLLIIHLLLAIFIIFKVFTDRNICSAKEKIYLAFMSYKHLVLIFQFPIVIWICNISFVLYYIDLNFLKITFFIFKEKLFTFPVIIPFSFSCLISIIYAIAVIYEKLFKLTECIHTINQTTKI